MSRSYKKSKMIVKDSNNQYMKRQASKRVRHYSINKTIPNGRGYKRLLCSWDISDYRWIWTEKDAIKEFNHPERRFSAARNFATLEDYLNYHKKYTTRK